MDTPRVENAVRELLAGLGLNPDEPTLKNTPARVAQNYTEFFSGMHENPLTHLANPITAGAQSGELVSLTGIGFRAICEHHLLPFRGIAHIAYQPNKKLAGLGSLPKVVHTLANRPQLQERLGEQIAHTIEQGLQTAGVLVVLRARHGCLADRGAKESRVTVTTLATRGTLKDPQKQRLALTLTCGSGDTEPENYG